MDAPIVRRVNGALVDAQPLPATALYELVRVGERNLLGEVIRLEGARATIQVFEDTNGVAVGEPVTTTGGPLMAHLGPGLLGSTLDGLGRPLDRLADLSGDRIGRGLAVPTLDHDRAWEFTPSVEVGAAVEAGDVVGTVVEQTGLTHHIMVPPAVSGEVTWVCRDPVTVEQAAVRLGDDRTISLAQSWPVRIPRPVWRRLPVCAPFVTGQRVLDLLFPVGEGGAVSVPGGFGTGKTVIEQSLAKWAHADVVVYVGCGERGNEMADVLEEFAHLEDPDTGRPVKDRTVLIANTSNMPVVAREASVYLGFTVAEYYRDMGYRVALMADSLSRWAEALREIGSRAQEMPAEEGYPTYLSSRLARLFERAGRADVLGRPRRAGAVTFIAAVSPPGGDFSEPVTQASLRVSGALWALDPALAHRRQFPAVDWESSYTLYDRDTESWFADEVAGDWSEIRNRLLHLLQRDSELREVAGLVGPEALEDSDRLVLHMARLVREFVIGQNAFDREDAYSSPSRSYRLASGAVRAWRAGADAIEGGRAFEALGLDAVAAALGRIRDGCTSSDDDAMTSAIDALRGGETG